MLTSLQNPFVKQLRKLHRTRDRHNQQIFLIEGTHLLEEAVAVQWPILSVCCTLKWQDAHADLWTQISSRVERAELVSEDVLKAIATTVNPGGVVAVAARSSNLPLTHRIRAGIAVETVQDPGNLGTIIRTAAAAAVDGLWISADSVDPDHPKVLRSSAGQWFRVPMQVSSDLRSDVQSCKAEGVQIIATLPEASQSYWDIDFQKPSLLLMGNEGAGLSVELGNMADIRARIPSAAGVESINVAIATALMLYEMLRQRRPQ
ncbi:MAG: TrmH family RNA methyltransferase [Elainellaceae cyanobacterium]